ncbi:uncharacterized protein LOC144602783 [Rhinoraja longicauda]
MRRAPILYVKEIAYPIMAAFGIPDGPSSEFKNKFMAKRLLIVAKEHHATYEWFRDSLFAISVEIMNSNNKRQLCLVSTTILPYLYTFPPCASCHTHDHPKCHTRDQTSSHKVIH